MITGEQIILGGLILRLNPKLIKLSPSDSTFKHLKRILRMYRLKAHRNQTIQLKWNGHTYITNLDKSGRFSFQIPHDNQSVIKIQNISLCIVSDGKNEQVMLPPYAEKEITGGDFKFGVISDIDDTVLVSHATRLLLRLKHLLLRNPFKRREVSDMAHFYTSLQGKGGQLFYVSNSEINLFPVIRSFLDENNFPKGSCFLKRKIGYKQILQPSQKPLEKMAHKLEHIRNILDTYPDKDFFLIGDNGQLDDNVYEQIRREYPRQIRIILLRNIHGSTPVNGDDNSLKFTFNHIAEVSDRALTRIG